MTTDVRDIPVLTVSYNSPELLRGLLASLRRFYPNRVHVVDGSDAAHVPDIRAVAAEFDNVELHVQGYNIHHGPGLAWALDVLDLGPRVLILDSDIVVLKSGFLEAMAEQLDPRSYGIGGVAYVNRDGFDIPYAYGAVPYLHPPCMLCNVEVMKQWPLPIKHGAPMVAPMLALHDAGKSGLLQHIDWVLNDVTPGTRKVFVDHIGRGTVNASGSYNLDEWMAEVRAKQACGSSSAAAPAQAAVPAEAPPEGYNADLLALIPLTARRIVEVGCSTGALAHAVRRERPDVHYVGMEYDPKAAELARRHCDAVRTGDIEAQDDAFWASLADRDCWVFGDVLEHLRDPWAVLTRIREQLPPGGSVVVCVPNAQHWSVQGRLAVGEFRYEADGLLDRTHLRWFTRVTLFEMFQAAGLRVEAGAPRIFNEPQREPVLAAIRQMAIAMGRDPEGAVRDALPLQYVMRAVRA